MFKASRSMLENDIEAEYYLAWEWMQKINLGIPFKVSPGAPGAVWPWGQRGQGVKRASSLMALFAGNVLILQNSKSEFHKQRYFIPREDQLYAELPRILQFQAGCIVLPSRGFLISQAALLSSFAIIHSTLARATKGCCFSLFSLGLVYLPDVRRTARCPYNSFLLALFPCSRIVLLFALSLIRWLEN